MQTKPLHSTARILASALLLVPLWFIYSRLDFYGGMAREVRLCLSCGAVAGSAAVLLIPILRRGDWVQRILAFALLVFPVLALLGTFLRALDDL